MFADQLPPHDIEAEESLLGALMVDEDLISKVAHDLDPRDFFRETNGMVYAAIVSLFRQGVTANQITVAHEMAKSNQLDGIGGQAYLADLIYRLPTSIGAAFYAEIVKKCAVYRQLIHAASGIMSTAYAQPADQRDALDAAVRSILSVGGVVRGERARSAKHIAVESDLLDKLEAHMAEPWILAGMTTGMRDLDYILDGYQKGNVYLYAAETSLGKSQFILDRILWQLREERSVTLFSTEMSHEQILTRLTYMQAGIDRAAARRANHYTDNQKHLLREAYGVVSELPLVVVEAGGMSASALRAEARRWHARGLLDHMVIDHMDHLEPGGRRVDAVTELMQTFKHTAEDLKTVLHAVSHMNRKTDKEQSKLSRLKDGSAKEQDSDVVMFITPVIRQEDGSQTELMSDQARAFVSKQGWVAVDLEVGKNRGGITGSVAAFQDWRDGGRFKPWRADSDSGEQGSML